MYSTFTCIQFLTTRLAVPISHELTLVAKRSEHSVSDECAGSGDTFTNISVLLLPPADGPRSKEIMVYESIYEPASYRSS